MKEEKLANPYSSGKWPLKMEVVVVAIYFAIV